VLIEQRENGAQRHENGRNLLDPVVPGCAWRRNRNKKNQFPWPQKPVRVYQNQPHVAKIKNNNTSGTTRATLTRQVMVMTMRERNRCTPCIENLTAAVSGGTTRRRRPTKNFSTLARVRGVVTCASRLNQSPQVISSSLLRLPNLA
jgi:hypothetical protein